MAHAGLGGGSERQTRAQAEFAARHRGETLEEAGVAEDRVVKDVLRDRVNPPGGLLGESGIAERPIRPRFDRGGLPAQGGFDADRREGEFVAGKQRELAGVGRRQQRRFGADAEVAKALLHPRRGTPDAALGPDQLDAGLEGLIEECSGQLAGVEHLLMGIVCANKDGSR